MNLLNFINNFNKNIFIIIIIFIGFLTNFLFFISLRYIDNEVKLKIIFLYIIINSLLFLLLNINSLKKNFLYYKYIIINIVKINLILLIIIYFFSGFNMDYRVATSTSLYFMLAFVVFSIVYLSFIANKQEFNLILTIYKIYFPIIVLITIMIYTTFKDNIILEYDYHKTKFNYEINSDYMDIGFSQYEKTAKDALKIFDMEDTKQILKDKKGKRLFFINLSSMIIVPVTLFMYLWFLSESSRFKVTKKDRDTIRQKINRSC